MDGVGRVAIEHSISSRMVWACHHPHGPAPDSQGKPSLVLSQDQTGDKPFKTRTDWFKPKRRASIASHRPYSLSAAPLWGVRTQSAQECLMKAPSGGN